MEKEIWKDVKGYEGLYQVSSLGRMRSLDRVTWVEDKFPKKLKGEIMKSKRGSGYSVVSLCKNGKRSSKRVHRLVAEAFIKNENNKKSVNHIDGVKSNNVASNLEWVTDKENTQHSWRMGLSKPASSNKNGNRQGEKIQTAVLNEDDVRFIRKNAKRYGGNFKNYELAEKFGVTKSCIQRILSYKSWKHVEGPRGKENRQALSNTGYANVYKVHNNFQGWFNKNKKRHHCGTFKTPKEAYEAVIKKRKTLEDK